MEPGRNRIIGRRQLKPELPGRSLLTSPTKTVEERTKGNIRFGLSGDLRNRSCIRTASAEQVPVAISFFTHGAYQFPAPLRLAPLSKPLAAT